MPDQGATQPIDLASALQLAAGENPQVGFARQRIAEAYAQRLQADALWLPSIRAGANYNKHDGRIQDVAGRIIETERGSVYAGLGAQAIGAGSPSVPGVQMAFHVKDAIFQPTIADRALGARRQASRATTNDVLLDVALAYQDLLEAAQVRAVALETVQHSRRLAELTADFARTGQGLPSDADRARADLALREVEAQRASETVRVSSTRLARLIRQDQSLTLAPQEPVLFPVDVVDSRTPLQELVAVGLSNRPELAECRFLVGEAVQRLRREKYSPLVPSVLLGMSYGTNGGGLRDELIRFGDRIDFDAIAFWEVRNLGLGERNARAEACARVEQARWRQAQALDQVAADVAEAHAQVESRREQVRLAETGIRAARDSHRRNLERIREGQGLPIETLQAIVALDQSQRQYVRAVADYNRAQFRLHRALGCPEQAGASDGR